MRILFLLDDFPPIKYTSASTLTYNLAKELLKKGHRVFVITSVQNKLQQGEGLYEGIKVFRIFSDYHIRWQSWLSLYNPQAIFQLKKIIKQIKPDISHFHHIHQYLSYHSFKIAKQYSQAVFLTAHDVMLFHYAKLMEFINQNNLMIPQQFNYKITPWPQIKIFKKRYNPLRNIIIKHYLKYVDKIFAVSDALKDALNQNRIRNVEVIHNGIDVDEWQIDNDEIKNFRNKYNLFNKKIIFFGGRLSALKGGEKIIKAMKIVIKEIPESVLLVAGKKDDYTRKMLELSEKEGVPLILTGWIKENELKAAYWNSHIVTVPSICLDSFPTTNLEAMSCKRPVIGTCFGGTLEIVVDGQTGYIVNPLNIQTMAEKIIDLLKNPQQAKQFGEAGYERIKQKFSIDSQLKKTLEWYLKFTAND